MFKMEDFQSWCSEDRNTYRLDYMCMCVCVYSVMLMIEVIHKQFICSQNTQIQV
jgi:hypothetical protein